MTTIYGGAQVLARNDRLSPATRDEVVTAVAEEAERLRRLVDDLLVVADAQFGAEMPRDPVLLQRVTRRSSWSSWRGRTARGSIACCRPTLPR